MKQFTASGYLLRHSGLEIRLIYTGFLVLVAIGLLTLFAFQAGEIGPTPARVASYYRGGEHGADMAFEKTFRQLVEVTHFHAFIMGMVYLVLGHLFLATTIDRRLKHAILALAFFGLAGDLIGPWLIRYGAGGFAYLLLAAWIGQWVGFTGLIYCPVKEMWFCHDHNQLPPD